MSVPERLTRSALGPSSRCQIRIVGNLASRPGSSKTTGCLPPEIRHFPPASPGAHAMPVHQSSCAYSCTREIYRAAPIPDHANKIQLNRHCHSRLHMFHPGHHARVLDACQFAMEPNNLLRNSCGGTYQNQNSARCCGSWELLQKAQCSGPHPIHMGNVQKSGTRRNILSSP
jgi:hypothetical protein